MANNKNFVVKNGLEVGGNLVIDENGNIQFPSNSDTNAATATQLETARTIALGGDVSGSASFDGSENITITATVADDSHNHIIGNVDGLQNALDGKVNTEVGKGLSTEDYTTAEKSKLAGIEAGAEVNTVTSVATKTGAVTLDKSDVGLANVDNTSDVNKPISTATQTALNLKAPLASPALSGTPTAPTAVSGTNTTQIATTAFVQTAVSGLVDAAPAALDTLNELAAALGDDPNFATTVSTQIGTKLNASAYTAADVLTKIKTVDGSGSGLDADLLDGQDSSAFAAASHTHTIANVTGLQSALDGKAATSHTHSAADITSGVLNADRILKPQGGNWFNGGFVQVPADGVSELGKYLDFHATNAATGDFDYRLTAVTGGLSGSGSFSASIFYDSANTSKFVDPEGSSKVGGDDSYIQIGNDGGGRAAVIGNTRTSDGTSISYGAYWAYDSYYNGSNWAAVRTSLGRKWVMDMGYHTQSFRLRTYNGVVTTPWADSAWTNVFTVSAGGTAEAGTDFRAPIFYDSANTSYYVDPASTSNLVGLTVANTITGSITGSSRQLSLPLNQTEYTILSGPANGPVIKVRYDSSTANRYIDIGTVDGNGVYYEGLKIYNGETPTWKGSGILHAGNYNSYSPTKTGGGASGTWGINITGNAATISGQANSATITASTGVDANNIVRRDGNGYIYANHINFSTSESENPSISSFITSNGDGWSRKSNLAHVKNQIRGVADGTWGINITGNAGSVGGLASSQFARNDVYNSVDSGFQVKRNIGSIGGSWEDSLHTLSLENGDAGNIVINFHRGGYTSHNLNYNGTRFYFDAYTEVAGSSRAPIFYDSNNTSYYVNPASTSYVSGEFQVQQSGTSGLRVVSPTGTQSLWVRAGYSGAPTPTSSPTNIQFQSSGSSAGTFNYWCGNTLALSILGDYAEGAGSLRAPIFYDSNNTGYYLDPTSGLSANLAGEVRLNSRDGGVGLTLADGALLVRNTGDNFHKIWYYDGIAFGTNSSHGHFRFYGETNTQRNSGTGGANLRFDIDSVTGDCVASGSLRAPVLYDSNDSGFYLDPNSTAQTAGRIRGGTLHGPNISWGDYLLVGGNGRNGYIDNTTVASVCTTDGNLHLDAASAHDTYINYYDGNRVYIGTGANGIAITFDSSGNGTFNGNVTAFSDINLKDNIEVIPNAVEKVSQCRGVTYTRKDQDDKEKRHAGVIAQEVEAVLPEVVETNEDGIKSVAYGNMVGLLIEAIKEQQTHIERLESIINKAIEEGKL